MTEEEKRTLALYIMAQEQQRLTSSTFRDHQDAIAAANHRRIASNQAVFSSLAQQGITWQQLKKTYDDAFNEGYEAMIDPHLSYLYAGTAIAYHEAFNASPEDTVSFVSRVAAIPEEVKDRAVLIHEAKEKAGVDTTSYDDNGHAPTLRAMMTHESKATRKDKEAVARMKKTGITAGDLEYEKQLGYSNGWKTGFCFSACYAAVAIVLAEQGRIDDAVAFIDRLEELRYEEITSADIIERAKEEAGVDVSGMIKG